MDAQGHIYASFVHTGLILKLSPSGKKLASWPNSADGLAVDRQGNVYAAAGSLGVQKLSPGGKVLSTFGPGSSSDARLNGMFALCVAVDRQEHVYVSDSTAGHKQVIKFSPAGKVLAIWR